MIRAVAVLFGEEKKTDVLHSFTPYPTLPKLSYESIDSAVGICRECVRDRGQLVVVFFCCQKEISNAEEKSKIVEIFEEEK